VLTQARAPPRTKEKLQQGLQGLRGKAFSQSVLLACSFMQKKLEFVVVLVQKGRNCALASKNKDSFLLRFTVWGCMQENSMLFILDIIISLTQITGRGGAGVPCCGLKAKGVRGHAT
jgi:hypothetical protein